MNGGEAPAAAGPAASPAHAGARPAAFTPPDPHELSLWEACQGGSARARDELFVLYRPFARQIAARHFRDRSSGDIEFDDLAQLAAAGLLEAIDHFDPRLGVPFRAYARRRIAGSVLDGVAKMSEVREQIAFRGRLRRERLRSLAPTEDTDALPAADALQALVEVAVGLALGFMLEDAALYHADEAPDGRANAYETLVWRDTVRHVLTEVAALPEREKVIVRGHYLAGRTFDDLAAEFGVSRGRISQIHRAALGLLRKRLRRTGDFRLER